MKMTPPVRHFLLYFTLWILSLTLLIYVERIPR
jgi:hypothetical protein